MLDIFFLCTFILIPSWQFNIYLACKNNDSFLTLYGTILHCRQLTNCANSTFTNIIGKHSVVLSSSCLFVPDAEPAICIVVAPCQSTLLDIALVQPARQHPAVMTDGILYPWPLHPTNKRDILMLQKSTSLYPP